MVGESGIGKTTSVMAFAHKLHQKGQPVIVTSLEKNQKFDLEAFLIKVFGTNDRDLLETVLQNEFISKNKIPLLIIDNIHYALDENKKINEQLLTCLNNFYQRRQLSVIMLSSVNNSAYEIMNCIFFYII